MGQKVLGRTSACTRGEEADRNAPRHMPLSRCRSRSVQSKIVTAATYRLWDHSTYTQRDCNRCFDSHICLLITTNGQVLLSTPFHVPANKAACLAVSSSGYLLPIILNARKTMYCTLPYSLPTAYYYKHHQRGCRNRLHPRLFLTQTPAKNTSFIAQEPEEDGNSHFPADPTQGVKHMFKKLPQRKKTLACCTKVYLAFSARTCSCVTS